MSSKHFKTAHTKTRIGHERPLSPLLLQAFQKAAAVPLGSHQSQHNDDNLLKTRFQRARARTTGGQKESWRKSQTWYSDLVHLHFRLSVCQVAKLAVFPLSTIAVEEADAKTATNLK